MILEVIRPILLNIGLNFGIGLILALSLNIEVGFANIPQFGRLIAALIGAIAVGGIASRIVAAILGFPFGFEYISHNSYIVTNINMELSKNPLLSIAFLGLSLAIAAILGGFIGYASAYPSLRLREAYLGITLLSIGEILRGIAYNYSPIVGGSVGIMVPDAFRFLGVYRYPSTIMVILLLATIVFFLSERIARSPIGRTMKAVRDSELAAQVYGIDIVIVRKYALIIGGSIAAIAGALRVLSDAYIGVGGIQRYEWTFLPWAYIMLGGVGNNLGVVLGVLIFSTARSLIMVYKTNLAQLLPPYIDVAHLEYIFIGLTIVLITMFRPRGILPEKPTLTVSRKELESIKGKIDREQGST